MKPHHLQMPLSQWMRHLFLYTSVPPAKLIQLLILKTTRWESRQRTLHFTKHWETYGKYVSCWKRTTRKHAPHGYLTNRKPDRPHAIRTRTHSLPQAGRDIQAGESHLTALQGWLQKRLWHHKSDKHHSLLGRGTAGMENFPAGELPRMEPHMLIINH